MTPEIEQTLDVSELLADVARLSKQSRAKLREWFSDDPHGHYRDLLAALDAADAAEETGR